jgi:predicted PurR-regulated permease PerM
MKTSLSLRFASVLLILVLVIYIAHVLQEILQLLAFSFLLAMLIYPICLRLEKREVPRMLAITIAMILLVSLLSLLVYLATIQILNFSDQLPLFNAKMETFVNQLQGWASRNLHISRAKQVNEMRKYSLDLIKNSASYLSTFIGTTGNALANMALIPIFVFFILLYRDFFRKFLYRAFGRNHRRRIDLVLRKINYVVKSYISGLFLVIIIVAILNTIGLLILGIDYAPFFGTLAAFLLLIPYIGITIGATLPILYALITKDSSLYALGVAGVFGFVQMLEANFITPQIVGSKVSINPLAAMIALILGGQLWGIAGLILALPFTAIIKVVFDNIEGLRPYGYLLGDPEHLL